MFGECVDESTASLTSQGSYRGSGAVSSPAWTQAGRQSHRTTGLYNIPLTCAVVILILNLLNDHTWEFVTELDSRSKDLKFDSHSWSCVEVLDKNSMLIWVTQP